MSTEHNNQLSTQVQAIVEIWELLPLYKQFSTLKILLVKLNHVTGKFSYSKQLMVLCLGITVGQFIIVQVYK